MNKNGTAKKFTQEEVDFIRENVLTMTIKEIAYALKRPYASIYTQVSLIRRKLPTPKCTPSVAKKQYTYYTEPEKKPFQRPPAVYSNKPTGIYYQP